MCVCVRKVGGKRGKRELEREPLCGILEKERDISIRRELHIFMRGTEFVQEAATQDGKMQ